MKTFQLAVTSNIDDLTFLVELAHTYAVKITFTPSMNGNWTVNVYCNTDVFGCLRNEYLSYEQNMEFNKL